MRGRRAVSGVIVMLACLAGFAPGQAEVRTVTGERATGEVLGIDADGRVRLQTADGARTFEKGQVVAIDFGVPAMAPPAGAVRLDLVSGDVLFATIEDGNFDEIRLSTASAGTLSLFLDDLRHLVYLDNWSPTYALPAGAPEEDELLLAAGSRLDRVPGELVRIGRSNVVFSYADVAERPFSFVKDRVAAIRLAPEGERPGGEGPRCTARFRDGSRLSGALVGQGEGGLRLKLGVGPEVTLSRAALQSLGFVSDAFRYLSDLEPVAFREVPFLEDGPRFGLLRDRGFDPASPLAIGDATYRKGIALHARSEATWPLEGGFKSFRAQVGVDPFTRDRPVAGSVSVRVLVDGEARWSKDDLVAGEAPVSCVVEGLEGASQLTVVVDFGRSCQIGARGMLGDAMLLR